MKLSDLKFFKLKKKVNEKDARYVKPVHRETVRTGVRFVNHLPWDFYVTEYLRVDSETVLEECFVIHKDGCIQQTYGFRGHDIESFSKDYIAVVFEYFNSQIKRLGDGWMVSVEAQRFKMHDYPSATFNNVAGLLVDLEREEEFRNSGEHYDSSYYINFVYKPESEIKKKATKFFFKGSLEKDLVIKNEIVAFRKKVENITAVLSSRLIIRPLDCTETVNYLHSTCSSKKTYFTLPDHFMFLDSYICDCALDIGKTLKLGEYYIPIVEINDFPMKTYPSCLNELNKLNIEYRWVSRYFPLHKEQALAELKRIQQNGSAQKKSSKQLADEMMFGVKDNLENKAAQAVQDDAEFAMLDLGQGINGYGYYNSCVMVWDKDYTKAIEKMNEVMRCIGQLNFLCKEEEYGSFEAFKGMMAGNVCNDIRRPLISTGNYSQALPFSAIWSGIEHNKFHNELCGVDKPLITCCTYYGSNFYLNLNDGDVGHTLIIGPTGAGKSTLLSLIEVSALKYPGLQVFIMDYGLSALTLTLSVGGVYVNPDDEGVCFQPFEKIGESEEEFQWAVDYVKTIIEMKGVNMNPRIETCIEDAMRGIAIMPVEMRTFTSLCLGLTYVDEKNDQILKDALKPYCLHGRFGKLFDGDKTTLGKNSWTMFEMQSILAKGDDCSIPAILYIFHFLEQNFDGRLTYFVMDECWFGLENEIIRQKMSEYLLTLRKKNVFCIFATQSPSSIANSPLASIMIQNCPTQIFLADPKALKNIDSYMKLGLSEEEVNILNMSTKKMDYYFKSALGTRLFQLGLGPIQLALFRNAESSFKYKGQTIKWHDYLKFLLERRKIDGERACYVDKILDVQNIPYRHLLEECGNWESLLNRRAK